MRRIALGLLLAAACGGTTATTPPAAPTGLVATGGPALISLTWTAVSGASTYVVFRREVSGGSSREVGEPGSAAFTDAGIGEGETKFYVVRAVGPGGTSGDSAEVSGTAAVEPAPSGLVAIGGVGQITLTWNAVPGAAGYNVFGANTGSLFDLPLASPTTDNSYVDTGLAPGTSRHYAVRAFGPAGASINSAEVTAVSTPLPGVPAGLVAVAGQGQISLSWTAAQGATSYVVGRSATSGGAKAQVATVTAASFTDTGLLSGSTWFYAVHAAGPAGASADSAEASATALGPAAPGNLLAVPANGQVSLTWSAVASAASYRVLRAAGSGAPAVLSSTISGTAFTDDSARNGTTYRYTVRSVAAGVSSGDSAPATAQPFRELCVADLRLDQVTVFNAELDGVPPRRSFGSQAGLFPLALAVDPVHGEIFSSNQQLGTVTTYLEQSNDASAPLRSLALPNTGLITYDATDDDLVITVLEEIRTFPRTATSAAAPIRTLDIGQGALGKVILTGPAHGDRLIFIGGFDNSLHFAHRTDNGATAPPALLPDGMAMAIDLDYDAAKDELIIGGTAADGSALVVALPASGATTAPARTILGSDTFQFVTALTVDESHRDLYLIDNFGRALRYALDFAPGTNPAPDAILVGDSGFNTHALGVDPQSGTLVVGGSERLLFFTTPAGGKTAPAFTISGDAGGLSSPEGIIFDKANLELAVANGGPSTVTFYPREASGAVTPSRTLVDTFLPIGNAGISLGFALDPSRDQLLISSPTDPLIVFYDRNGSIDVARLLAGDKTRLVSPFDVALNPASDAVVVADAGAIRRYSLSFTDANQAPFTSIEGPATGLSQTPTNGSLFVDEVNGEIFIAQNGAIRVFNLTDDGDVAPKRVLVDQFQPSKVIVDPATDEMFVLSQAVPSIQVYSRTASGSDAPVRNVLAPFSGSGFPFLTGMAICN